MSDDPVELVSDEQLADEVLNRNVLLANKPRAMTLARELRLAENIPYNRWVEYGRCFAHMQDSVPFWIGDWMVYGEERYGDKYSQGVSELEVINPDKFKPHTLSQYRYVSRKYGANDRVEGVSWSHHSLVAGAEPEVRQQLLEEAASRQLSVKEFRELYNSYRVAEMNDGELPDEQNEPCYCCPNCGNVFRRSMLTELLTDRDPTIEAFTSAA